LPLFAGPPQHESEASEREVSHRGFHGISNPIFLIPHRILVFNQTKGGSGSLIKSAQNFFNLRFKQKGSRA
jgi:hypothetical protein